MTEDELIREIQLKHQLSELDGTPAPEYDPSDGMETVEELKKYVRFLYELNQEKDERILRMESDMSEIKNDLKEANRRADEEAAGRKRLFDKLEKFMDEQKSDSDKYKELARKYETLQGRYDLLCAAHYGGSKTCSDKYRSQKNDGINDGRDDFDGSEQSLPKGTPGPVGTASKDTDSDAGDYQQSGSHEESDHQSCYHGPDRTGAKYNKETVGEPIIHKCIVPEGCKVLKVLKPRKIKTLVQRCEEHHFERLLVRLPNGKTKSITVPAEDDVEGNKILHKGSKL